MALLCVPPLYAHFKGLPVSRDKDKNLLPVGAHPTRSTCSALVDTCSGGCACVCVCVSVCVCVCVSCVRVCTCVHACILSLRHMAFCDPLCCKVLVANMNQCLLRVCRSTLGMHTSIRFHICQRTFGLFPNIFLNSFEASC